MGANAPQISIIDKGTVVEGSVSSAGKLVVKGTLEGSLTADHVIVSKEGIVSATTETHTMTLGGTFKGHLQVTGVLTILATGTCSGTVQCRRIAIEAGGVLNAEVVCNPGREQAPGLQASA